MSVTRANIRAEILDRNPGLGRRGTTTAEGTNQIVDTNRLLGIASNWLIVPGAFVNVNTTGTTWVQYYLEDTPAKLTGAINVQPDATIATALPYELWHPDLQSIEVVNAAVNRGLTSFCHQRVLSPVSVLNDADMEASGTTNWLVGGGAVLAKGTAPSIPARQSLTVTGTGPTDYAYQNFNAEDNSTWHLVVVGRPDAAGAAVHIYNVGTGVEVTLSGDGSSFDNTVVWQILRNVADITTGGGYAVRLDAAGGGNVCRYISVMLWNANTREFILPSRITSPNMVGTVYRLVDPGGSEVFGQGSLVPLGPTDVAVRTARTASPCVLRFSDKPGSGPYFYEEWQPYDALTTDALTSEVPLEWAAVVGTYELVKAARNNWRSGMAQRLPGAGAPVGDINPWTDPLKQAASQLIAIQRKYAADWR